MSNDNLLSDEEPQTEPLALSLFVTSLEWFKQDRQELRRNHSFIMDDDRHLGRIRPVDPNAHHAARRAMVHRIADQVREHLEQPVAVPLPDCIPLHLGGHRAFRVCGLELVLDLAAGVAEVDCRVIR